MSFKDEQVLSFEATADTTSLEYLTYEVKPNLRLLKMAIIYGANASGKTNLLFAIETLLRLLRIPRSRKSENIYFEPFAFTENEPTEFKITFYIEKVKYQYNLLYNKNGILYEKMEYAPNGIISLFYERELLESENESKIKFGNLLNLSYKAKRTIEDNTFNNHTLLSTFEKITVDAKPFELIHDWLDDNIHNSATEDSTLDIIKKISTDENRSKFIFDSLFLADFNISKIEVLEVKSEIPNEIREQIQNDPELPISIKEQLLQDVKEDTFFTHHCVNGDFVLRKRMESTGTLSYLKLLDRLYDIIKEDHISFYDEVEESVHYDLLIHYLSLFMMNSKASQLIFTTHDQLLLDEDFIRRDMVWFTDKSKDTGGSELYSAAEFGLHKNISLYKAYKVGKLGAKPELGSIFLENR
jgi:AAA15 family ATPase/GTPase